MYKKSLIVIIISIIIIFIFININNKVNNNKEHYFNISNLYRPGNDASVWRDTPDGKIKLAYNDRFYTAKKITPQAPSPPDCVCPKCPDIKYTCPTCPSEEDILRKYGCIGPIRYENRYPITYNATHYQLMGYLHKLDVINDMDKYKILPLYGKEYKGGFFKYYTQFISGDQVFRKLVFKPPTANHRDYSREIYEGDIINIDTPINAKFRFQEEKLDNRIDIFDNVLFDNVLFDEDPFV